MLIKIKELEEKRFQFLLNLYKITKGNELISINRGELAKDLGLDHQETESISDYLQNEGLINYLEYGGMIGIAHKGVVQIEKALSKPDKPTEYFPPINFLYVGRMNGSQIQQGAQQSVQSYTASINDSEVISRFIQVLKERKEELNLDPETKAEIDADITTIETQLISSRPKKLLSKSV